MRTRKKRIRKSTKYFYVIIAIVLLVISTCSLVKNVNDDATKTRTRQVYEYTSKFNYNYQVNLLPNKYIDNENNGLNTYVTELIDDIDLTLNYSYKADKNSDLNYEYEIIGKMQAYFTKDNKERKILEKEEVLQEKVSKKETTNNIQISDKINLNLQGKNALLNEFKQELGMSVDAKYIVLLRVNIKTNIDGQDVLKHFETTMEIDLAEKTTEISGENNKEDTQYIAKKYQEPIESPTAIFIDIIVIGIAVYLLGYSKKAKVVNKIKNEYKRELNRILKLCQDKIVQVSTTPETEEGDMVLVKDFGEIIKLSEELFKPILYYNNQEDDEAEFIVMGNRVTYKYLLKK